MSINITDRQRHDDGSWTWLETETTPEHRTTTKVTRESVDEVRLNCYCCSCPDYGMADPYCRNHEFGFGVRPCETHAMPGEAKEDGTMPDSVQTENLKRKTAGE